MLFRSKRDKTSELTLVVAAERHARSHIGEVVDAIIVIVVKEVVGIGVAGIKVAALSLVHLALLGNSSGGCLRGGGMLECALLKRLVGLVGDYSR